MTLDENAVRKLGNTVTWYIPLGLGRWFSKRGITRFVELDWWQKVDHQGTTIVCVPAMVCKTWRLFKIICINILFVALEWLKNTI